MILRKSLAEIVLAGSILVALPVAAPGQQEASPPPEPCVRVPERQGEPSVPLLPLEEKVMPEKVPVTEPPPAFQGPFSNLMGPSVGHLVPRVDYRATWFPDEEVRGQPTNLGYVQQDISVVFPVWQGSCDEWSASASVRN